MLKLMAKLILSAAFIYLPSTYAAPINPQHIIVFGDSYSDNGNVFKMTKGAYPNAKAYWHGRFSNGLVWAEYLAKNFNINPKNPEDFMDFAYGQAKVLTPTTIVINGKTKKTYPIPDLSDEIDSYVTTYKNFSDEDLIVVFISTNDFFDQPALNDTKFFQKIADQEAEDIQRLINLGARHIIVLNGRDVTQSPLALNYAHANATDQSDTAIQAYLSTFRSMIGVYNQRLALKLQNKPQVFLYNIFGFDQVTTAKINHGGLRYTIDNKNYTLNDISKSCYQNNQGDYQGVAGHVCTNPGNYFFYDRIHTTTNVNYLLAQDVYQQYQTVLTPK